MNIEEQVLTIEQAKHLQELGLGMSDAAIWYVRLSPANDWNVIFKTEHCETLFNKPAYHDCYYPTYTLQELIGKLPIAIKPKNEVRNMLLYDSIADCQIWYENYYGTKIIYKDGDTLLDAAYQLLCWVIANGYLKEEKE